MDDDALTPPSEPDPSAPLHYTGRVMRFSPMRGIGQIRSDAGREITFDVRFLEMAGVGRGDRARDALEEGMRVGFDVGWTSRGLRVTWLRHLDSEREPRAEGEVPAEKAADQNRQRGDVE